MIHELVTTSDVPLHRIRAALAPYCDPSRIRITKNGRFGVAVEVPSESSWGTLQMALNRAAERRP